MKVKSENVTKINPVKKITPIKHKCDKCGSMYAKKIGNMWLCAACLRRAKFGDFSSMIYYDTDEGRD